MKQQHIELYSLTSTLHPNSVGIISKSGLTFLSHVADERRHCSLYHLGAVGIDLTPSQDIAYPPAIHSSDIEPIAITLTQPRIAVCQLTNVLHLVLTIFVQDISLANRSVSAFIDIVIAVWMSCLLASKGNSRFTKCVPVVRQTSDY